MSDFRGFEKQLLRDKVVDEGRLERARGEAETKGIPLAETLCQLGFASPEAVYRSLAAFCEMSFELTSRLTIPPEILARIPARYATHYGCVPLRDRNGTLVVAIADPLNSHLLDDIRMVVKQRMDAVVTTPEELKRTIKACYGIGADTMERILVNEETGESSLILDTQQLSADLGDETLDASIIKFVNEVILEAIQSNTTDIHIEPFEEQLRVRFRIDGILHQVPTPPSLRGFHASIVSRVKVMANMNIAEKRLPQDGKILASFGEQQFDLRVSVLPTPHGETVNLRILSRSSMSMTLSQLGFQSRDMKMFEGFISRPHGIILVTGPTGSGKTTTLYAALNKLNGLEHKIITIEDPIEYQLAGVTQMQVQPKIGFDFAMGLRAMLRHDPDIMLVGEIRDYETAEMAIRSSLTGHLVLSTLHTNDAPGAVTRLIDMGVEPFLVSSTMIASVAQRLVRCNCTACAQPAVLDEERLLNEFGLRLEATGNARFLKGAGCDQCRHTGYRGRLAIYEIMPFSNEIKELVVQRATALAIKNLALQQGMTTLRAAGWARLKEGQTTMEEVMRVTADAEIMLDV